MVDQLKLRRVMAALQAGTLNGDELIDAVHELGEGGCIEAKPSIERLLRSPDPDVRNVALNVLTLHWGSREHQGTCLRFMREDPDPENRRLGAVGLGSLARGTRDPCLLKALLSVFRSESEEWHVRDSAYSAILDVLGRPLHDRPPAARRLDYGVDVDWKSVGEAEELAAAGRCG